MENSGAIGLLVVLGLGAVVVWWYLSQPGSPGSPATSMPAVQNPKDSCNSAGNLHGVPLCTSAVMPFLSHLNPFADSPPSIAGCPYGTRDPTTQVMQRTKAEVDLCLSWLKTCKSGSTCNQNVGDFGARARCVAQKAMVVCSPAAISTKGWRG